MIVTVRPYGEEKPLIFIQDANVTKFTIIFYRYWIFDHEFFKVTLWVSFRVHTCVIDGLMILIIFSLLSLKLLYLVFLMHSFAKVNIVKEKFKI